MSSSWPARLTVLTLLVVVSACTPSPPAAPGRVEPPPPAATTAPPSPAPASPSPAPVAAPVASVAPAPSTPAVVSFKGAVAPLLTRSCGGCHFPGGSGAGDWIGFDAAGALQHAGVKGDIDAIISQVERGRMPYGGRSRLTKAEVDLLKAWRSAGMPAE